MKKIITTLCALLFFFGFLFSKPVNEKDAKQIAINFYSTYAPVSKANSTINKLIVEKYESQNSFYIFSFERGGFVIVSADDCVKPILGYSFTSPVKEEFSSNIKYLFERYSKTIYQVAKKGIQDEGIKVDWENLHNSKMKRDYKAAGPLLETTWDQSPYYNEYCPIGTPTGCVATAMSQIMNYHEWPASGNGWHKYIPEELPDFGEQYADYSSEAYDWANMPNSLGSSSTSTQIDAIATLCYHTGVSVNMNYVASGSGAISQDVLYALTNYFKYDPTTIEYVEFSADNEIVFINTIKNEIDNSRPVYYDGQGSSGGHAWVCDGYDNSDNVHINWGWGGSYNGYFLLSDMAPGTYDFTDANAIIIGIQPGAVDQDMLWTKQASGFETPSRGIQYIDAVDARTAWATAADGSANDENVKEFTRTIDGTNWEAGTINAEGVDNYSSSMITAINKDTAWVALFGPSGGGKIVKTKDGGKNWEIQSSATFSSPNGFPNVVHFWDANNGWCQGDPNGGYFELYTTTDGGDSWTRVPQSNIPSNLTGEYGTVGYYAVYGDIVWFATNKGRIYKSTDKGYNWDVYQTPISDASFELSFRNENVGVIQRRGSGDNKIQYITNDGGENWTALNPTGNFYTSSLIYVPGTDILISTGSDYTTPFMGVSYSTDDGSTFTEYAEFYKNHQFLAVGAAGENAIWAGGFNQDENNDGMWHYGDILISSTFQSDKDSYCNGDEATFKDSTYGTPDSWAWDFGDGATPATASGAGPHTVSFSTEGTKNITLTITKGTDELILNKSIYVSSSLPVDADDIVGDAEVIGGETHSYSVTDQDHVEFIWDFPSQWTGSSTDNEIEISFDSSVSGTINVTPTNACGEANPSSLEIIVNFGTGINEIDNNKFSIYPNPSSGDFKLDLSSINNINERTIIDIISTDGSVVYTRSGISNQNEYNVSVDKSGYYIVRITTNNDQYSLPVIIK